MAKISVSVLFENKHEPSIIWIPQPTIRKIENKKYSKKNIENETKEEKELK